MLKYCRPVKFQATKHFSYKRNSDGPGTLYECQITASRKIFHVQLELGMRLPGGPVRRYNTLKINLKRCGINSNLLNSAAQNRSSWCSECHKVIEKFQETHVATLERKHAARKCAFWQSCRSLAVWQLLQDLYFQNRAVRPSTDPSMTSNLSISMVQSMVCACLHDKTKTAETTSTKLATGIVHHESLLSI